MYVNYTSGKLFKNKHDAGEDYGLLLSHKKSYNNAICSMDTLGDYHTKLSQIEKNKYHMVSLYMESKKKKERKIQMNVFTKWKQTQRLGKQTCGYQRGHVVGGRRDISGV